MKKLLTTALLLCSIGVMGQTGTILPDSVSSNGFALNGFTNFHSSGSLYDFSGSTQNNVIRTQPPSYHFYAESNKILLKVSNIKPDSTYRVWFDKKSIIWTSDSTFTLKAKQ